MSTDLSDADVAAVTVLLSPERLAALKNLTGSAKTAIELHQETLGLSAGLMNVTACIELALRNTVCENLTAHFATPGWLIRPPAPFQWREIENRNVTKALDSARRAEYSKLSQADKAVLDTIAFPHGRPANTSHLKRAVKRRQQIPVSDGKVVAEITLYFWKRLYSSDYEQTLWRTTLKRTFPNKSTKRPQVAAKLEDLYQSRNRLAHHEPVLHKRFHDTIAAIEYISENLNHSAPSNSTPLCNLIRDDLQSVKNKADALHSRLASYRN